ncbi:MAG: prepilin-type N-terminal cleavage/methylation domain-containing protein [Epulopiscium sp.]|nr:prepilin-type N-terminal cleavage/methylation domain-containing protein [Candidatus Epulonipiscium sp.]
MKKLFNHFGFTIIELIIIMAIMSILAAIVVPSFGVVQRNRIKSVSSQIAMDINRVHTYARTHYNPIVGGDYEYKIVFSDPVTVNTKDYFTKYELCGPEVYEGTQPEIPAGVLIRPVMGHSTEILIKEIQFDEKGRVRIKDAAGSCYDWNAINSLIRISVEIEDFDVKKEVLVNQLTAKTTITE